MSTLALILGWGLIWTAGCVITASLVRERAAGAGKLALVLGTGWFIGAFLLTLWMRALSMLHVPFGILSIGIPFAIIVIALAWHARRWWGAELSSLTKKVVAAALPSWQRGLWAALAIWLAARFALLLVDVVLRPLYPWDAWTQWSTKARVWFELHTIVPFVTAPEWLAASDANVYFDAAPHYPGTIPLWQVWAATLIGHWDDSLVNLPWWLTAVALGFAIYGFLAQEGFSPLTALLGAWLVLSLPILDVHIALAGYADLPMAAYLTLAAGFVVRAGRSKDWRQAVVAVTLIAACTLIKNPGKVWVVTLLPGLLATLLPEATRKIALASLVGAIAIMVVLAQTEPVILGYHLHLDFQMPWNALADAYFQFGNWHLLWYGALAIALLTWRQLLRPSVAPYTLFVAAGMLFLMFGFAFTNARVWVEDQSTVNRATLHLAPLVVLWMLMSFQAWARSYSPPTTISAAPAESTG